MYLNDSEFISSKRAELYFLVNGVLFMRVFTTNNRKFELYQKKKENACLLHFLF